MATIVDALCPICLKTFKKELKHFNLVVKRSGKWSCKPCVTVAKNKAKSHQIGSVSLHKKTGYLREKTKDGWSQHHKLVMERNLGRKLLKNECVHHKNEIKTDNRIENLQLMTMKEHTQLHHIGTKRSVETCAKISNSKRKYCE